MQWSEVKWSEVKWSQVKSSQVKSSQVKSSQVKLSGDEMCGEVEWSESHSEAWAQYIMTDMLFTVFSTQCIEYLILLLAIFINCIRIV
jgi:hypothetical protein